MDLLSQIGLYAINFYHSAFFVVIKFILGVYVAVLVIDIVLIMILKGFGADVRTMLKGMDFPAVPKSQMRKKWAKIRKRLESDNVSQYKVAIIEADSIADKILAGIGFRGKNMTERLEAATPAQLDNLEDIRHAHQIRNRVIQEASFSIDKETAEQVIEVYEKLLKNLELL
ncbi:MAG: hypothetical protein NT136_01975 [Candidatus Moranbacteria bacterium]|nr:hypothetical protein [Candidatus Moranbacteria bacterium]